MGAQEVELQGATRVVDRALELAGELSAAPGPGGKPIYEWLEVRPFLTAGSGIAE